MFLKLWNDLNELMYQFFLFFSFPRRIVMGRLKVNWISHQSKYVRLPQLNCFQFLGISSGVAATSVQRWTTEELMMNSGDHVSFLLCPFLPFYDEENHFRVRSSRIPETGKQQPPRTWKWKWRKYPPLIHVAEGTVSARWWCLPNILPLFHIWSC